MLRYDLHLTWDKYSFSLLPKQDVDATWKWAVHINTFSPADLHTVHHNRILPPITGVSSDFLFARFAWDIFPRLRPFLDSSRTKRWLKIGDEVSNYTPDGIRAICTGQGAHRSLSPGKNGGSPSKRQREGSQTDDMDVQSFDSGIGGSGVQSRSGRISPKSSLSADQTADGVRQQELDRRDVGADASRTFDRLGYSCWLQQRQEERGKASERSDASFLRAWQAQQEENRRGRKRRRTGSEKDDEWLGCTWSGEHLRQ